MSFQLIIEKAPEVFSPGQTIFGRVFCSLREPQVIAIQVRLVGKECISTPQQTWHGIRAWQYFKTRKWDGKIEFLQTRCISVQSGKASQGEHNFPFKVTLPRDIPSSFKGKYGHVKYFIEVYLTTNFMEIKKDKVEFKVISPVNVRDVPNASLIPKMESDDVVTRKWCCIPELIRMDVELKKKAFVEGEIVNAYVIMKNSSYLHVSSVTAKLYLINYAKVSTPTDRWEVDGQLMLSSETKSGVRAYETKTYTFQLKVPNHHHHITNFQKCKLFAQKGVLQVTAVFENSNERHLEVRVNLVLGHQSSDGQRIALKETGESSSPDHVYGLFADTSKSYTLLSMADLQYPTTNFKPTAPPSRSGTAHYRRTPRPATRYGRAPPSFSRSNGSSTYNYFQFVDPYGDLQDSYRPQESSHHNYYVSALPAGCSYAMRSSDSACDMVCYSGGGGGDSGGGCHGGGSGDSGGGYDGGGGGDSGGGCDSGGGDGGGDCCD